MPEPRTTTEYRVVRAGGEPHPTARALWWESEAVTIRGHADEDFPRYAPHRVQSRTVTVGEWQDVQTEEEE